MPKLVPKYRCGRRKRKCSKCEHRYSTEQYEMLQCPVCGTSRLCQAPVKEKGVACRFHGGRSKKGPAAGAFKTGRYSRHLPTRLADKFAESLRDPDLLSLRSSVALLDVRVTELIERLHSGEAGSLWKRLRKAWAEMEDANRLARESRDEADRIAAEGGDASAALARAARCVRDAGEVLQAVGRIIRDGAKDEAAWRDLVSGIKDRAEITRAEHARLRDMQQMMSVDQAMSFVGALLCAAKEVVADGEVLQRLSDRVESLLSFRGSVHYVQNGEVVPPGEYDAVRGRRVLDVEAAPPGEPSPGDDAGGNSG